MPTLAPSDTDGGRLCALLTGLAAVDAAWPAQLLAGLLLVADIAIERGWRPRCLRSRTITE